MPEPHLPVACTCRCTASHPPAAAAPGASPIIAATAAQIVNFEKLRIAIQLPPQVAALAQSPGEWRPGSRSGDPKDSPAAWTVSAVEGCAPFTPRWPRHETSERFGGGEVWIRLVVELRLVLVCRVFASYPVARWRRVAHVAQRPGFPTGPPTFRAPSATLADRDRGGAAGWRQRGTNRLCSHRCDAGALSAR